MSGDRQAFWKDHAGLWRLARILAACALLTALVSQGFAPRTRFLALLTLAAAYSGAAIFELSARDIAHRWFALPVVYFFAIAAIAYAVLEQVAPAPPMTGVLIAAHERTPANACSAHKRTPDDLVMIFGHDAVIGHGNGPFMPALLGSCPLMRFTRTKGGGLLVNGFGYDSDGNVVYGIKDNVFNMILRGFLFEERPDASTIRIFNRTTLASASDEQRVEFSIRYLNRNTVLVRGTFRCDDSKPMVLEDRRTILAGKKISPRPCTDPAHPLLYSDPPPTFWSPRLVTSETAPANSAR